MKTLQYQSKKIIKFEKLLISKKNRFQLNSLEKNEIKQDLQNENILITGASGSIGKVFTTEILSYDFKNLYLLDKNENNLTQFNRQIVYFQSLYGNIKKNVHYICSDLTSFNLDSFLQKNKITIYLNFAAIKHVRSEEELDSALYMLKTNSISFLPKKKNNLKKIFSISSDKSANPFSILGISKLLMENKLAEYKNRYNSVCISSVRFANVIFSEGSIFQHIMNQISKKEIFGIPNKVKRYFITHEEAVSLCLKSLLKKNDGYIIIPNKKKLGKIQYIKNYTIKILKAHGYKAKFISSLKNKFNVKSYFPVLVTSSSIVGQKNFEVFSTNKEKIIRDKEDSSVSKIELKRNLTKKLIEKKLLKNNTLESLKKDLKKLVLNYRYSRKQNRVSHII
jgi:FlaA1/EpsC-like NDP-sugar epimerase